MAENPLEAIRILVEKLEHSTEPMGLQVMGSAVIPGRDDMPDMLQVMFKLDTELLTKTDEERMEDEILKGIQRETYREEQERKAQEAEANARKLAEELQMGSGIFDDDD